MCYPLWHDQTKVPGAERVKDTAIKRMIFLPNALRKDYWKQTKLINYLCEKKKEKKEWRVKNLLVLLFFEGNLFENSCKIFWMNVSLIMDCCILGLTLHFSFTKLHMFKFFKHYCYWMLVFFIMICLRSSRSRSYLEGQS